MGRQTKAGLGCGDHSNKMTGLTCPNCSSEQVQKKWSWCRTREVIVGHEDSGIERKQFLSRNTKYICDSCHNTFVKVTKLYPEDKENDHVVVTLATNKKLVW